ncbi:DUF3800 domain-containing protein [Peribacillus sp. SCS-155]|uniref:DUF3800 domain-containing protein n=1 Tax=Peribacillus sedimenti TaxID=3115297 RepID=UPI003905F43B
MTEHDRILERIDEEILTEEEDDLADHSEEEKEAKRRKKAAALWTEVQAGNTKHLITKVASILNRFPDTRNSDVALMVKYWEVYEGHKANFVSVSKLFRLERLTSISRTRAKIQNEYGLFKADEKIRRFRQNREETQKEYQIATKPSMDFISIYADESGKNDDFAIVGSMWILAEVGSLQSEVTSWVQARKQDDDTCPDEFHFNKINNGGRNLTVYKDFIDFVVSHGHMISFKAIAVNKTKIAQPIDEIITELFYQLVRTGVEHEQRTGRVSLPRQIAYFKDAEDGESAMRLNRIEQSLRDNFTLHYQGNLRLNAFTSIDSKYSRFIQISDLFTGAINRRINHQRNNPESSNAKDEFANYIYQLLNIQDLVYPASRFSAEHENNDSDHATLRIFD